MPNTEHADFKEEGDLIERFIAAAPDALEAQAHRDAVERRHKAMLFAMDLHMCGEGDPQKRDALEVARTAETFDRFLRGDGVAPGGKPEAV